MVSLASHYNQVLTQYSLVKYSCPQSIQVPQGLTKPLINKLVCEHEAQLKVWKQYTTVEQTLKYQLIAAFDGIYLKSISNGHTGFATLTLLPMLQHLYDTYGDLTPTELEDNDERMKTAYDITTPVETLYDQIEQAVDIAEAGHQPYTNAQVLSRAYNLILTKRGKILKFILHKNTKTLDNKKRQQHDPVCTLQMQY